MKRIGDILIEKKLLKPEDLERALDEQKTTGEFLGDILVRHRWVAEEGFTKALAEQNNMPFLKLKDAYVDWEVAMRFPSSLVLDRRCLPLKEDDNGITMAITNPLDADAAGEAEQAAHGIHVRWVLVTRSDMNEILRAYREKLAEKIKRMLGP